MSDVRWLDASEMRAWRELLASYAHLVATLDAELRHAHGLTFGDYEVLVHLSEAPDRALRMVELAGRLRLSPSGLTRRLDGLVRDGLVGRQACPRDRRGSYAVLTDLGLKRLEDAAPTHVAGVRAHYVDRLDAEELRVLGTALARIAEPLPAREEDGCEQSVRAS